MAETLRPNSYRVNVSGLNELRRGLKTIDTRLPRELASAGRAAAAVIALDARGRVPVRSGRLQASIRPLAAGTKARVAAGNSRVPYAPVIEFGWPGRFSGRPFLYAAVAAKRDEAIEVFGRLVAELINRTRLP